VEEEQWLRISQLNLLHNGIPMRRYCCHPSNDKESEAFQKVSHNFLH